MRQQPILYGNSTVHVDAVLVCCSDSIKVDSSLHNQSLDGTTTTTASSSASSSPCLVTTLRTSTLGVVSSYNDVCLLEDSHHHQHIGHEHRRRVRFAITCSGKTMTKVHENHHYTTENDYDAHLCWYSPEERLRMQQEAKYQLRNYARLHPQYCSMLEQTFFASKAEQHDNWVSSFREKTVQIRGLESSMSKLIRQHRRGVIHTVLKLQKAMTDHCHTTDPHQLSTMRALGLRACSVHATQKSRAFALFMASIDAEVA